MSDVTDGASLPTVGFVILSHRDAPELRRLIDALNREYDFPRIVVHHDFGQAALSVGDYPEVSFVRPSRTTGWAKWGVVEGALDALTMLYNGGGPDWFFLLSAVDYPVAAGRHVKRTLAEARCDGFVDARPLKDGQQGSAVLTGSYNPKLEHFAASDNVAIKKRFYLSTEYWVPLVRFSPRLRIGRYTYRPPWEGRHPFRGGFNCFYGDHWLTGNRRVAAALLSDDARMLSLKRHYRLRTQADESFYATVLANAANLILCLDNRRFAEWNGGGAHPISLQVEHAPEALASGAFFARKVSVASGFADAVDAALDAERQLREAAISTGHCADSSLVRPSPRHLD
jgi:hypothetical protein